MLTAANAPAGPSPARARATALPVQPKLRIGATDDPLEREADATAERIMRMAQPPVATLRRCPGGCPDDQDLLRSPATLRRCPGGCSCDQEPLLRAADGPGVALGDAAERDIDRHRRGGAPLPPPARAYFEPRFGASLAGVRVHADPEAGRLARQVQARAFTVGRHMFFGPGEYRPATPAGRRLLAHELTHTLQQARGQPTAAVQRACNPTDIGAPEGCEEAEGDIFGTPFRFNMSCDTFVVAQGELPDQKALLLEAASDLAGSTVNVHGFASADGDATFNRHLSCRRALVAADLLRSAGVTVDRLFAHGATPGPAADRRSVVVDPVSGPAPAPEPVPEPEPAPEPAPAPETPAACTGWVDFLGPALGKPPSLGTDFAECLCLGVKVLDVADDLVAALVPVVGTVVANDLVQLLISLADFGCALWDLAQLIYAVGTSPGPCFEWSAITGWEWARIGALVGVILADVGSELISSTLSDWLGQLLDASVVAAGTTGGTAAGSEAALPGMLFGGATGAGLSMVASVAIKEIMERAVELLVDISTQMLESRITHGTPFPLDGCQACFRMPSYLGMGDYSWMCGAVNQLIPEAGGIIREPAWHGD
jgi:hypothetical protein